MLDPTHTAAFEQAKVHFRDGLAHLQAGRPAEAETAFLASLDHVPARVSTLVNLAATRMALNRPVDALVTAVEVLAIEPTNADALAHCAAALRALGRHAEAVIALDTVLAQRSGWAEGWLQRGQSLLELNRPVEALPSFDRALALDATLGLAWASRGDILRDMGRLDEARAAYEQALALGVDADLVRYCLAGLGQAASPPAAAPRAYVETLFDAYAGDFEQHLVQTLRYRAPDVLVAPLAQMHPQPFRSVLDLGCGTGLCGPLVRERAQRLVGVDLSQKMLEQARARGVYDELVHADIVAHLQETQAQHDLVLAADVFIYIGDLSPVFAALGAAMLPGGLFCFSTEMASPEARGFELLPSLRYAHAETYLRELAAQHGFEVLRLSRETIREDQQQAIDGVFAFLVRR